MTKSPIHGLRHVIGITFFCAMALPAAAHGYDCEPESLQKLYAYNAGVNDEFGWSVAVDGDFAAIGEIRDDYGAANVGTVSVFQRGLTWGFRDRLRAPDETTGDLFGFSVDIDDDLIVVGAPQNDTAAGIDSGAAYVYRFDGLYHIYEATLLPPDGHAFAEFGCSVAVAYYLNSPYIAVGARYDNEEASQAGAVYMYHYIGGVWEFHFKLTANDAAANAQYGWCVSRAGKYLAVGAPGKSVNGPVSGGAYVYELFGTAWIRRANLLASDGEANDNYGTDVGINDEGTVIVGAYREDTQGNDAGAAYIYRRNVATWPEEAKLMPADGDFDDCFGYAVAIAGDTVVVSAAHDETTAPVGGSAYSYRRVGGVWVEDAKLTAADVLPGDQLGWDLGFDGTSVILGARSSDDPAMNTGAAYVFAPFCAPEIGDMNCDGVLDMLDIGAYALALTDAAAYTNDYEGCDPFAGDTNGDTQLDGRDTAAFIAALIGN